MSSVGAAPRAAVSVSSARAEASRKNGARSRGPKTAAGKARSAQNALRHGLRAEKYVVLADEDADEFGALEAALEDELAPAGALQRFLARRVACAAWRLMRAERLEVELFAERRAHQGGLGLALIRDGNGSRSFETLLRYRGAAQAELWRALRTLEALQAEARAPLAAGAEATVLAPAPLRAAASAALPPDRSAAREEHPNQPEPRRNPGMRCRFDAPANPSEAPRASDPGEARVRRLERPLMPPGSLAPQPIEPGKAADDEDVLRSIQKGAGRIGQLRVER
jgi:hypothetical protein